MVGEFIIYDNLLGLVVREDHNSYLVDFHSHYLSINHNWPFEFVQVDKNIKEKFLSQSIINPKHKNEY